MRRAEIIGRDNCQGVTSGPLPCWVRLEPPGAPDSRPVMKGTALLNLYLAVLENGVPSASLRRERMGAQGFPLLSLWCIATVLGEDHWYGVLLVQLLSLSSRALLVG